MCDEWTGEWTNWSPWDKCRPSCGAVRYSVRSRDCKTARDEAGDIRDCVGTPIEYWRCAKHPCAHGEETFLNAYFSVRQNAIASGFATTAVICGLITAVWAVLFRSTLAEPVNLLVVKVGQWIHQRRMRRQGSAANGEPPTSCSQ
ncbi:hypothetical protein EG68_11961 [Paragonimus skrjabini miyazakii]|uniref:Uncharacterized protein n=1 Tax=Paragonimus skrjabini miyazakii TaxID=59628 RepID=A0A8S9Y9F6_9TREM|nr:hypothetical protein EG68_11961 [Paragonimus skrjabini miyazakii]